LTITGPQPGTLTLALPLATSVCTWRLVPIICSVTGTRQSSGFFSAWSRLNSDWVNATLVLLPLQLAASTRISGTPGCSVKSCAMPVTGLPAARSILRHRSSETVLLYACSRM
jgi:hypothetical protein